MRAFRSFLPALSSSSASETAVRQVTSETLRLAVRTGAVGSRKALLGALLLTGATNAYAQDAAVIPAAPSPSPTLTPPAELPPEQAETTGEDDVITVTGSRIVRNGYDAPTPVTVIGLADIQAAAPANVADFVNQIPSVAGSVTPSNTQRNLSGGNGGINTINLRSLGTNRTLVLLDGHRSVGSVANGTVDVNTIPQGLVKSVEVVTGGAASVYGSDAVAGVVNFILDREYTGLKGEISYGETTYGDDVSYRATLTGGVQFADGRGRALLSGNYVQRGGVYGAGAREWQNRAVHLIQNPRYVAGNGQPEYMESFNSGLNTTTGGGIITSTRGTVAANGAGSTTAALRGTYFGSGGTLNRYNYGANRLNNLPWTVGGDYQVSQHYYGTSIQPEENLTSIFGRFSFDVTDNLQLFTELSYNRSKQGSWGGYHTDKANVVIAGDNAFIPAALRTQLNGAGFTLGTWNQDIPTRESNYDRNVQRYLVGVEGSFDLLALDWKWDGYYQRGITNAKEALVSANRDKLNLAADAVFNSAGQIVCRSVRDGSTNPLAVGCVPFNRMGIGVNSQAAIDYIMGEPYGDRRLQQDVAALNVSTSITNPWLKPIGIAFGVESREEQISGFVPPEFAAGWYSGNFTPTFGSYTVTEAYGEALVSLPFEFEFSGAARYTSYSESGDVVTWKAGLSWQPIPDLRLRVTRSRDIRAPNLSELFQGGARNTNSIGDPWQGNAAIRYTQTVTGNLALEPEKADTWGLGLIYRPSFIPGLGLSVDYYDIKIKGAIGTLGPQEIIDRCFTGTLDLCERLSANIGTDANPRTIAYGTNGFNNTSGPGTAVEYFIANSPYNFLEQRARGLDFELSYQFDLADIAPSLGGKMSFRGIATRYLEASESNGVNAPTDTVGQNGGGGPPKFTYRMTLGYAAEPFSMQVIGRGFSAGVYNNQWVECAINCPASNTINRTIADNHLSGAFYVDTYFAYDVPIGKTKSQLFFRVANLFNRDPAPVGKGPSDTSNVDLGINQTFYDYLGRTFRIGLRFDM
ncbi:TonB-dependent receptor domain-containing protein [Sphingomonas radiodurans]|uniref:TonB-dependent receptor domain-containing protein n=1 Tax=Sphingomonas radiodurans TaxID=2890321 RepID=UPI001E555DE7|nr:TonB-dependent receptor [Sphingomonas radiodurans]WBH15084.1 TonB-dependent receptor [Sphingomonas radiodurans]